jgi:hypothetical protein
MAIPKKIRELSRVVKLHSNWLVYATLGESALTKEEIKELEQYGRLPMGKSLDLVNRSYVLGRMKALLKRAEYKQVSYEAAVNETERLTLSPLEELVIEQARLKAGSYLKNLATEIGNGVFDSLAASLGTVITEATVRDIVANEIELGLLQKKTSQEVASSLAAKLQTGPKKNWKRVAQTELHRAKIAGHAQAIVNKIDVYQHSAGADSLVSVVPAPQCCADCTDHYLDSSGSPKVFKLADLLAAGSNDTASHTKKAGKHLHWKTTLPPLHPSCGCQLVYIPPGYGWSAGKLSLLQKSLFEDYIQKARSGVSGGISSTVKPKGAPSQRVERGIPSQPGAAAPGNVAGPGRPSSNPATPPKPPAPPGGGGGGNIKYSECPFGGGSECQKHGGNGATQHKTGGTILRKHQEAIARGAKPRTEAVQEEQKQQQKAQATAYDKQVHPKDVLLTHLSEGEFSTVKELGKEEKGANISYKATIVGNGSGCMKPPPSFPEDAYRPSAAGIPDGISTTPKNRGQHSEVAAHHLAESLGLTEHVPPTTLRHEVGMGEGMSIQHWQEGKKTIEKLREDNAELNARIDAASKGYGDVTALISCVPEEHRDKVETKLREIAVLDIVQNNNDRHYGNLVFSEDLSDVRAIDHGLCFGAGMQGHKNTLANGFQKYHKDGLTVPDHLLTQFKAHSLADTERHLESKGISDWQIAQTHLRKKFIAHLQDTHGQIPMQATRSVVYGAALSDSASPTSDARHGAFGWSKENRIKEFLDTDAEGQLPDQVFSSFAKHYITTGASDPSHPEHEDCKRMLAMKPLVAPGHGWHAGAVNSESSRNYWDSVPAYAGLRTAARAEQSEASPMRNVPSIGTEKTVNPTGATELANYSDDKKTVNQTGATERASVVEEVKTFKPGRRKSEELTKSLWLSSSAAFPRHLLELE